MKRKERLGDIVARRQFNVERTNKRVTVFLGKPFQVTESGDTYTIFGMVDSIPKGEWLCPFKITGLPKNEHQSEFRYNEIWGRDSLDALLGALKVINTVLDKCRPALQWSRSDGMDTGFPLIIEHYGLPNKQELIEKTVREVGKAMKKYPDRPRSAWTSKRLGEINKDRSNQS
jgi:hypothetical protein